MNYNVMGEGQEAGVNQSSGCLPFTQGRRPFTYHVTIAKDKILIAFKEQKTCFLLPISFFSFALEIVVAM